MSTSLPTPRSARRRPARDEVRRALLDAAATCFARRGIDASSIDDVAAVAGFTKGAVYSNFGSKEGLVDALFNDKLASYLQAGMAAVGSGNTTMAEKAQELGDRLTATLDAEEDWTLLFLELWQRAMRSPGEPAFLERRRELHLAITEELTAQFARVGLPPPLPPEDLATVILALTNGLAMERRAARGAVPDDLFGRTLSILLSGHLR